MRILGIETSCDETAVAIVDDGRQVLAHALLSQVEDHRPYGGIVPEIAARSHLDHLDTLVQKALDAAGLDVKDIDGFAATSGPGLIGGVLVGVMTAKAMASVHRKPFLAINHLEGHALTARFTDDIVFPYLLLLVSGGHCQVLLVRGVADYGRLGTTLDDAAGECFDKVAKMLGLAFPGGPAIEEAAKTGDPDRFPLPRPLLGRDGCDFSFSGMKTAVRHCVDALPPGPLHQQDVADLSAALQHAVVDCLVDRLNHALDMTQHVPLSACVAAGGVAANSELRNTLTAVAVSRGLPLIIPPPALCTDNGIMIAWAGVERLKLGLVESLDFKPKPRWPLETLSA